MDGSVGFRMQPWREELKKRLRELKLVPTVEKGPRESPSTSTYQATSRSEDRGVPPRSRVRSGSCSRPNAQGAIDKCESYAEELRGDAPATACACKALLGAQLGGGARRRTAKIALLDDKARHGERRADRSRYRPADQDDGRRCERCSRTSSSPIAPCASGSRPRRGCSRSASTNSRDVSEVTATDRVQGREPAGQESSDTSVMPLSGTLAPESQKCVAKVLREHARIPCPDQGIHPLEAELHVRLLQQP